MDLGGPQSAGAPTDTLNIPPVIDKSSETMESWSEESISKNNRLLFLTVEYVDDNQSKDFSKAFPPYEQVAFSPRASSPVSDFEHRVSPLDPNMSSTARYSPTPVQFSSLTCQNPVVVLPGPPSPLIISTDIHNKSNINYTCSNINNIHNVVPQSNNNSIDFVNNSSEEGLVTNVPGELILMPSANNELTSSTCSLMLTNGEFSLTRDFLVMHDEQLNIGNPLRNRIGEISEDQQLIDAEHSITMTNNLNINYENKVAVNNVERKNHQKSYKNTMDSSGNKANLRQCKKETEDRCTSYCKECNERRIKPDECTCQNVRTIADEPVPSRARATLPVQYLTINKLASINVIGSTYLSAAAKQLYGVFAKCNIQRRTQFGPIEGVLYDYNGESFDNELPLLYETKDGKLLRIDVSNENTSNWMRFVRPAESYKEQNLIIIQQNDGIVFLTTRDILPKEELKAGPSVEYGNRRNLTILLPESDKNPDDILKDNNSVWLCIECNTAFDSPEKLDHHFNNNHHILIDKNTNNIKEAIFEQLNVEDNKLSKVVDSQISVYACPHCPKVFPQNYNLRRHILTMHCATKSLRNNNTNNKNNNNNNNNNNEHQNCNEKFVHNRSKYMKILHETREKENTNENTGEWKCTVCNLMFGKANLLNIHKLIHEKSNKVNNAYEKCLCPQCDTEFGTKYELINHVSKHGKLKTNKLNVPGSSYKCTMCYKRFATKVRLQQHYLVHGSEDQKPLSCNICLKRFMNNSALSCHLKTHRQDKQIFECPMCRQLFNQILMLKEHIETHKNIDNTFTCPDCKRNFNKYSVIRKHIKAHHYERKHKCQFCIKRFPTVDKLRMHLLRHSDYREFHCANCEKQFKRKDKLKEHMTRMHNSQKIKREQIPLINGQTKKFIPKVNPTDYNRFVYKCHQCLVGFKRRGMLVNHLAKRHPDVSPDSVPELNLPILRQTRDYYCQYCEKVYKSSSKRKAHIMKNHPGAALPPSNRQKEADSSDSFNSTFSQAVGSVTTAPQSCQWCHKQYASKAKLLQHQRKKHSTLMKPADQIPRPRNRSSLGNNSSINDNNFIISEYLQTKSNSDKMNNLVKSKIIKMDEDSNNITDDDIELIGHQIIQFCDVR